MAVGVNACVWVLGSVLVRLSLCELLSVYCSALCLCVCANVLVGVCGETCVCVFVGLSVRVLVCVRTFVYVLVGVCVC